MLRSNISAALLTELAAEHGLPPARALRGTGIAPASLEDPEQEITARQELALVRNLVTELAGVPALGLLAGTRYQATAYGVWGFAALSSPTMDSALGIVASWFELSFSFSGMRRVDGDGVVRLEFDATEVPADVRCFNTERDLGALAAGLGPVLPDLARHLLGMEVALPAPVYAERYVELFGITPVFDAPATTVVFDSAILPLPLPQANRQVAELCARQCAELLQRRKARVGVGGSVRDLLLRQQRAVNQGEVAAALNLSVRTLRRKLAEEGTTFRELAAETSGVLAEELLRSGLTVEQIAARLGYADASSFTHAFKAWRGVTPGRFARDNRTRRLGLPV